MDKKNSKKLLIAGIIGCLLYVFGDFLFAATGRGQSSETIGFMVRVAYLEMGARRMIASILCGFIGTFHDLRHSCASLLLSSGVPMKQIQEWLGHSDFSTTANIYSHLEYSSKLTSADALAQSLGL